MKMTWLFNPTQPEMIKNSYYYEEERPPVILQKNVSLFYQFRIKETSSGSLPVIPDGCIDLLFCFDSTKPFAVVATSPLQRCTYEFRKDADYFGVRLYPEQGTLKFQCSLKELIQHQQIPLFDAFTFHPSIIEELAEQKTLHDRMMWFTSFLTSITYEGNYDLNLTNFCLDKIYSSYGSLNIRQLSSITGYTDRYIRKKFDQYIGFSPKEFCQIVRLQKTIQELLDFSKNIKDETVDDLGFFDKSHFYKEFKKYMSITPKQYKDLFLGYSH